MNVFQMKTRPNNGPDRIREFIEQNFVCIGWPGIGNLECVTKDEIRKRLKKKYNYIGHQLGYSLGQVNSFINTMKKGDVVLVTEKDWVHIGIVGEYEYQKEYDTADDGM